MPQRETWIEISTDALESNVQAFRSLLTPGCKLAPVVKSNAYGHGLVLAAKTFLKAGADMLCVNDLWEADILRTAEITQPIWVLGHISSEQAADAVRLGVYSTVYDPSVIAALDTAARQENRHAQVFLKAETGTNRQGLHLEELRALARLCSESPAIELTGMSMHFADIEDTTDHSFAASQLAIFDDTVRALRAEGFALPFLSVANSAATILWPSTHKEIARVGIAMYGMWPSRETLLSATMKSRHHIQLKPALQWKTRIAQIKTVEAGQYIGYGRTFRTTADTTIAIIPVGYYDGFDRRLSGVGHVLIRGKRAPIRGRICMNMSMVDVTHIPQASCNDEVTLLGQQGDECISAELLASWIGTINYEVTTRISESIERIAVQQTTAPNT